MRVTFGKHKLCLEKSRMEAWCSTWSHLRFDLLSSLLRNSLYFCHFSRVHLHLLASILPSTSHSFHVLGILLLPVTRQYGEYRMLHDGSANTLGHKFSALTLSL